MSPAHNRESDKIIALCFDDRRPSNRCPDLNLSSPSKM